MKKIKILFMGTPEFSARCLSALCDAGENVIGCVTGADRARGRGMKLTPTPVKKLAEEKGVPVFQPNTLRGEDFAELLISLSPDLIIVAAYGKILPKNVLEFPRFGCVNAHASLLPKYRGASPIQRAVMAGERESGVCAMMMDEGLDTGDIILREKIEILPEDTFGEVHDKLADAGGRAMVRVCRILEEGKALPREKQDSALSTYAEKITPEDLVIDFTKSAQDTVNMIRAFSPAPGARCALPDGKILKITRARAVDGDCGAAAAGEIVSLSKKFFTVACASGLLEVTEVVPEGKGRMDASAFINGRKIAVGDILQTPRTSEKA